MESSAKGGIHWDAVASREVMVAALRHDAFATAVVIALIVIAMQVASYFTPDYIMPPPAKVLAALWQTLTHDYFSVFVTLARLFAAVAFSMLLGTALGVLMGTVDWLRPFLRSAVVIDSGIPALSWILLAVFWFKNSEIRIFFILVVILVPFYSLNVYDGIRALSKEWLEMFESFRPSRMQLLRMLILPHIVPYILLTTKSVIGYATRMVVFAELIAAAVGIGARMGLAQAVFKIDEVLAWTVLLVVLNVMLQLVITLVERRLLRWRAEAAVR